MKKYLILLLAVCLAVLPCAVHAEVQQSPIHGARYYFEHKMIPQLFYEDPEQLMGFLRENGPFTLWERFTGQNNVDVTYSADEFELKEFPQEDGMQILMISMPDPPELPLCFRIYLCYDPATKEGAVFTMEYDNMFGDACFLCGWNKEGTHLDYGAGLLLSKDDPDYEKGLETEIQEIRKIMQGEKNPEASFDPNK